MELSIKTFNDSLYTSGNSARYAGDSGYDLYFPDGIIIPPRTTVRIDLKIQVQLLDSTGKPRSLLLLPRSSICKTPLRLANSVGLIDAGYRGNLIVYVDNISDENFQIEKYSRLFQIVCPDLSEFTVKFVDYFTRTTRGSGAYGSTGV